MKPVIFFMIIWWIESSEEQNFFEIEIFCNILKEKKHINYPIYEPLSLYI